MRPLVRVSGCVGVWIAMLLSTFGVGCHHCQTCSKPVQHNCSSCEQKSCGSCNAQDCGSCGKACKLCQTKGGVQPGPGYGGPMCQCGDAEGHGPIPRELDKVSMPDYIIEPPDIVVINTVRGTPLPPYRIEPLDQLQVQVPDALPNEPIAGVLSVDPDGTINLGLSYGAIRVAGLTLDQCRTVVTNHLKRVLKDPRPVVALAQTHSLAAVVQGQHLVRPDGTIGLGDYGDIYVAGMTRGQLKATVERTLSQYLLNPQVTVDVLGYNSKVYYVVFDGAGYGQQAYRMPITGNETVLDAITGLNGLPPVSSTKKIWVARPNPCDRNCDQVLPVDWRAIVQGGSTATNYQLMPGDRLYVHSDPWICADYGIAKVLAPFERVLGFTLLGASSASIIQSMYYGGPSGPNNNNNAKGFIGVVP